MEFNIFKNIISGAKYVASGQLGSDVYDATHSETAQKTLQSVKNTGSTLAKLNPITAVPYYGTKTLMNENVQGALSDTAKMYEQKAQGISKWSTSVANKPGYIRLGQMVKAKYPEYQDMSDEELGIKMSQKYPEYMDIVNNERTALGQGAKILGGIGSMAVSAPGMVAGGLSDIGQGSSTLSQAQTGQDAITGGLQIGKGTLKTGFGVATGATPIASTVFGGLSGTDTAQNAFGYIGKKSGDIGQGTAKFLGGNEQVQEQARGFGEQAVAPAILYGLSKGGTVASPYIKTGMQKTGKAISEVAPKTTQALKTGVSATGDIASAPFKSIYNTAKQYVGKPNEISGIQSAIKPKQRVKNGVVQRSQDAINNEITLTNSLIRQSGAKPIDLATYKTAIKSEMEKIGSEINRLTGQDLSIDITPTAQKLRKLATSKEVQLLDPSESSRLIRMADDLEQNGLLKLEDAEAMNQFINDILKSTTSSASEAYKRGLQILVGDIRDNLDTAISSIPGEFKEIKKAYGALRNVYGDTVAREIVFNRQNMGGLVDSIGAIEGAGNIMSGGGKILMGDVRGGISEIGRGITANAVGRFIKGKNDPNNIIRAIFETGGKESTIPNIPNKSTNGNITRNNTNSSPILDMGTAKKIGMKSKNTSKR